MKDYNYYKTITDICNERNDVYKKFKVEEIILLNKISLKGFILDSSCCINLNMNNIINYSIQELKAYLMQYENKFI